MRSPTVMNMICHFLVAVALLNPSASGFQISRNDQNNRHTSPIIKGQKKISLAGTPTGEDDKEPEFEPLDVILDRARKRGVNPMIRVQAFLNAPVAPSWKIPFTRGDVAFSTFAIAVGAKGFALGLVVGKLTSRRLTKSFDLPPLVVQLYPVLLAIACDQLL